MKSTQKMNPDIKKRWVDALRSGQYKQTSSCLTDGEAFCCLGVLCNLHSIEKKIKWSKSYKSYRGTNEYLGESGLLPDEVYEWAGMKLSYYNEQEQKLTYMNDCLKKNFKQIANYIEEKM